jgi:hypothetical protein
MLRRYGAAGFSVAHNYPEHQVMISLILPDRPGKDTPRVPVKLPISIRAVYDALYGRPMKSERIPDATAYPWSRSVYNPAGYETKKLEQAERVAWRNLVLWVDAALSAAAIGLQTITEAFFAHAVAASDGERMIEVVEQAQARSAHGRPAAAHGAGGGGVMEQPAAPRPRPPSRVLEDEELTVSLTLARGRANTSIFS